jgi:hypothetical protein
MSCWQAAAKEAAAVEGSSNAGNGDAQAAGKLSQDIREVVHLLVQCGSAEVQAHVQTEAIAAQQHGGSSGAAAMGLSGRVQTLPAANATVAT